MSARQPIDPAWWDTEHMDGVPMRHALAERDIKSVFQFLHRRGWSWGAIAQATDIGEQRVREIANGKRRVENYDVYCFRECASARAARACVAGKSCRWHAARPLL